MSFREFRRKSRKLLTIMRRKASDTFFCSYHSPLEKVDLEVRKAPLNRFISEGMGYLISEPDKRAVDFFLDHRFDLLGSGWVKVHYGMDCRGFENNRFQACPFPGPPKHLKKQLVTRQSKRNRRYAEHIWDLVSPRYRPIDWHIDFKSGYRWSEDAWYRDVRYATPNGADVKVPWELSRMQHLVEMALVYSQVQDTRSPREFKDQVLDWIASNPPRYGVNWSCTMEVAIRIANWVVAFDIFKSAHVSFSQTFEDIVKASVYNQCCHIIENLEWSEAKRGNHYLANICGLLVACAYLPSSATTDLWLCFAIQELEVETQRQFLSDGGHFEASTSYHRFGGEMIAVAAAFALALPEARVKRLLAVNRLRFTRSPGIHSGTIDILRRTFADTGSLLSVRFRSKLAQASHFSQTLLRRDGSIPIIGDNDSGRFLRAGGWTFAGTVAECRSRFENLKGYNAGAAEEPYLTQSCSSHLQWLAWASAITGKEPPEASLLLQSTWKNANQFARAIVAKTHVRVNGVAPFPKKSTQRKPHRDWPTGCKSLSRTGVVSGVVHRNGSDLFSNLRIDAFPESGLYVVRSERVHLVIRCGNALSDGTGIHAHDDQLSFDLTIDDKAVVFDPGSYVYTSSVESRNSYRSARSHSAPVTRQKNQLENGYQGCFSPPSHPVGVCLEFSPSTFIGATTVDGGYVVRTIRMHAKRIEITDEYHLKKGWEPGQVDPFTPATPLLMSREYGWKVK